MKQRRLPTTFFIALLLGACASDDEAQEVELHLPTQAESDAAAAKRIHKQNADAEMQKLEQEIDGDSKP